MAFTSDITLLHVSHSQLSCAKENFSLRDFGIICMYISVRLVGNVRYRGGNFTDGI